jgi:hypothetical protein
MPVNHYRLLTTQMLRAWDTRTPEGNGWYIEHDGDRYWWVYDASGAEVTRWECRPFPGCATLVVTTQIELRHDLRGRGLGKYFHELRRKAYKAAGFQGEVCTVRSDSEAQQAIVVREGTKMGTYPSDFGGTFDVWLLPLNQAPVAVRAPTPRVPAPTVDTCGREHGGLMGIFCNRPLGHRDQHEYGGLAWANPAMPAPLVETPRVVIQSRVHMDDLPVAPPVERKVKVFSHRKPKSV